MILKCAYHFYFHSRSSSHDFYSLNRYRGKKEFSSLVTPSLVKRKGKKGPLVFS